MERGWIKLYRKFTDWEWYGDVTMMGFFVHLLIKANFEDKQWHGIMVKRGQVITSRERLSKELNISVRCVRTCIDRLIKSGNVTRETTNQMTILTICNYDIYQDVMTSKRPTKRPSNDQRTTNERPTTDQQPTTTKERKELEERKELQRIKENNTLTRISDRTQSFFDWLEINCPYVFGHLKLPTDAQYDTLVERYGKNMIAEQCMQIENRADLRKKYKVLFPTLNNWCKRELKSSNQAEYEQQQRLLQYAEVAADFLNQSEMGEQGTISPVIPF